MRKPTKLTDELVLELPLVEKGTKPSQYEVRDTEQAGFLVRVGATSRTYYACTQVRDGSVKRTVKRLIDDAKNVSATKARKAAHRKIVEIQAEYEKPPVEVGPTLRQAYEDYKTLHLAPKKASEHTYDDYRVTCEVHLADWLDIPMRTLAENPRMMAERWAKLTVKKDGRGGKFTANHVARNLRAIYNHARTLCKSLPEQHPSSAIKLHRERRAKTAMVSDSMPEWWADLHTNVHNPIRREFHLITLLTGSRPGVLSRVQRPHINLSERALYLDKPKGGEDRAYWVPLSDPLLASVIRAMQAGEAFYPELAERWLFPAESEEGHLTEWKEDRHVLPKWGKDLRQTFTTMAYKAGISEPMIQALLNHRLARKGDEDLEETGAEENVTRGYMNLFGVTPELRTAQDKISAFIMDALLKGGASCASPGR